MNIAWRRPCSLSSRAPARQAGQRYRAASRTTVRLTMWLTARPVARPAAAARACSSLVAACALLTVRGNVKDDTIVSNTTNAASLFADGFIFGVLRFRMTALRARNLGEINRRAAAGQRYR